jgi:LexA-binding, inner membrane-associated putative hydrolase
MRGEAHAALGVACWLTVCTSTNSSAIALAGGVVVNACVAGGILSPDVDQHAKWPRKIPLLHRPLLHRGLTHWWGLQVGLGFVVYTLGLPWPFWALVCGWASHVLGDFLFGLPALRQGRTAGVPLMPWWHHVGVFGRYHGMRSDGWIANTFASASLLGSIWLTFAHWH